MAARLAQSLLQCRAQIIRVHDVKETVEALRVVEATPAAKENKRYE